ncbi:MAG: hypothetical protein WB771_04760 [Solirubrobacterales bacterium]
MSGSPSEPDLSVVVGSNGGAGTVEQCLAALESQRDGAEVIVCEPRLSPPEVQARFPWARFVERRGALVPELWSAGIEQSQGRLVALTISPMVPASDWIESVRAQQERHDAVAGAIEPAPGLRISDWAEYFCRYLRDMLPFEAHECPDLPGDNSAYKRELLERTRDLHRDGFWEPVVNARLAEQGVVLWHTPEIVVRQGRSAGARAFTRQRLIHGRAHGSQRGALFGKRRNLVGVIASPLVPLVLTARLVRQALIKRRNRARVLLALPYVLLFNAAWGLGEARGHLDALRGS